jgi:transposase
MADLLREMKAAVDKPPAPAVRLAPSPLEAFAQRADEVVKAGMAANPRTVPQMPKGGRPTPPPPLHLAMRRRDCKALVLAFMYDCRVPFDNTQGERDSRMVQVKQKVSGGVRTLAGAKRFGRLRGSLSTARKHAKNVLEAMRDAFDGAPFLPSPATH